LLALPAAGQAANLAFQAKVVSVSPKTKRLRCRVLTVGGPAAGRYKNKTLTFSTRTAKLNVAPSNRLADVKRDDVVGVVAVVPKRGPLPRVIRLKTLTDVTTLLGTPAVPTS
jgi:hypothetical protein